MFHIGVEISANLNQLALRTQRTQRFLGWMKIASLRRWFIARLINFGGELLKSNIERLVNELDELTL